MTVLAGTCTTNAEANTLLYGRPPNARARHGTFHQVTRKHRKEKYCEKLGVGHRMDPRPSTCPSAGFAAVYASASQRIRRD